MLPAVITAPRKCRIEGERVVVVALDSRETPFWYFSLCATLGDPSFVAFVAFCSLCSSHPLRPGALHHDALGTLDPRPPAGYTATHSRNQMRFTVQIRAKTLYLTALCALRSGDA
jgi:hypothetical protein